MTCRDGELSKFFIKETPQTVSNESLMDGAEHRQNFNEILPVMAVTKFN